MLTQDTSPELTAYAIGSDARTKRLIMIKWHRAMIVLLIAGVVSYMMRDTVALWLKLKYNGQIETIDQTQLAPPSNDQGECASASVENILYRK